MDIEHMKIELEKSIGSKLFGHCIRTMEESMKLAEVYNADIEKAKIAGLLHDCGKLWDRQTNNLKHAKIGADIAKRIYNVEDVDILNAIRYHTTGREAMSLLEKIIYIADKIEPNRDFEGVEELRDLAYNNISINEAIIKSLISTISYVKQRNLELDTESLKTLNYLNKRRKSIEFRP